jgi:COX assembly mitochondrial protein 1
MPRGYQGYLTTTFTAPYYYVFPADLLAFADCALGRTFSVVFKCRDKNNAMNACLMSHATPRALDEAREEWFARRAERAAERSVKAARKAEQEKLLREWWGLQDADGSQAGREDIQAKRRRFEESRRHRPERIGGMPAKDRPRFDDVVLENDETKR